MAKDSGWQLNRSSALLWIGVLAVMAAAWAARIVPGPRTIDDAFITFRYSRNIVEGLGFVYNPGVHTLGTTTPLFTLLMAAISAIAGGQDYPVYALLVSALADGLTALLLYLIVRRVTESRWLGLLPALLWAVAPFSVTFAIGGMETSVSILWMVAASWVFIEGAKRPDAERRWGDVALGVLAALGALTRIDAAIWIGPLLLWQLVERLRRTQSSPLSKLPLRTWLTAALVLLPWLVFSLVYFGSPLPNSLSAKQAAYALPDGTALMRLIQHYAVPFVESEVFTPFILGLGVVYASLSLVAVLSAARQQPRAVPFLIYPWLYMAAFAVANPLIFRWYLAPPLPALMVGIVVGIYALLRQILSERVRWAVPAVFAALACVWLYTSLSAWTLSPDHGPNRPAPKMAWHQIELYYEEIGRLLAERYGVDAQTRVASADIGAIGYFSRATIVDTVGLVTPEMRRYYPIDPALIAEGQNYAIPPQLIHDTAPAFLVTMEAFVRLGLERDPAFTSQYRLLHEIPTDFYGTGMRLYGRSP